MCLLLLLLLLQLMDIMVTSCRHHCIQTSEDPSVIQTDRDDHLKFYFTSQQIKQPDVLVN